MKKYVIERDLPAVGTMEREQLRAAAAKSNEALARLAPHVQWVHSYVTADRTFCIYIASDEEMVHKHAELSGFPASRVYEVSKMIDPTTAAQSQQAAKAA